MNRITLKTYTWLRPTLLVSLCLLIFSACKKGIIVTKAPDAAILESGLIPQPLEITESELAFSLYKDSYIVTENNSEAVLEIAHFAAEKIFQKTGLSLAINPKKHPTNGTQIVLRTSEVKPTEEDSQAVLEYLANPYEVSEVYELYVNETAIELKADHASGLFRGIQTLRQLLPEKPTDTASKTPVWVVPGGLIKDAPNFAYRGVMLDVARHFFTLQEVKRFIDFIAYYKINTLHLHLTDDQGWRIEIKKWPLLTRIGGSTEVGGGSGGFYTQEQYKDLVAYAAKHYINIIPEVDMPGHTNAASVAYPFLNGNGKTPELYTGIEVGFSTWDTQNNAVYDFVTDVVSEISSLSPGPYFHLGGDESHATKKKDYITFIDRVSGIVKAAGKTPIGWDEIVTANTDPTAVAQFWASEKNAAIAVKKGMKVLLSPAKKAYLDMQYQEDSKFGLHWAGYIPVDTAYVWAPETYVKEIPRNLILGLEAPLWSETISNSEEMEYLAFPRLPGYAELAWTTQENRSWGHYKKRLAKQSHYFKRNKIKYYPSPKINWETAALMPKQIKKD